MYVSVGRSVFKVVGSFGQAAKEQAAADAEAAEVAQAARLEVLEQEKHAAEDALRHAEAARYFHLPMLVLLPTHGTVLQNESAINLAHSLVLSLILFMYVCLFLFPSLSLSLFLNNPLTSIQSSYNS